MDKRKIGNLEQWCSIREVQLADGKGKGLNLVEAKDQTISFSAQPDNCLDLYQLTYKGLNISFLSPNGLVAGAGEFGRLFPAGMLYTCGLDSVGVRAGYPLHGHVHSLKAKLTEKKADEYGIVIKGDIEDTALFGQNLVLHRTIESKLDSGVVTLTDILENRGFTEQDYCLLYHINSGYPLVDEGTVVEAKTEELLPRTKWAEKNIASCFQMGKPVDGEEEMCYFLRQKDHKIALVNKKAGLKLTVSYGPNQPYLVEWKSQCSGNYVIGLEPTTTWLDDKFHYLKIKPGEKIEFSVSIAIEEI